MTERLYHQIQCPSLTKIGRCTCQPVIVADAASGEPIGPRAVDPADGKGTEGPRATESSSSDLTAEVAGLRQALQDEQAKNEEHDSSRLQSSRLSERQDPRETTASGDK
jgi:hypothetical protein